MRITSVSLRGFQCFGLEDVSIRLDDLTAFVGPNASGKTASDGRTVTCFRRDPAATHHRA